MFRVCLRSRVSTLERREVARRPWAERGVAVCGPRSSVITAASEWATGRRAFWLRSPGELTQRVGARRRAGRGRGEGARREREGGRAASPGVRGDKSGAAAEGEADAERGHTHKARGGGPLQEAPVPRQRLHSSRPLG